MLHRISLSGRSVACARCIHTSRAHRDAALKTPSANTAGDISSVFPSLSGTAAPPLPARFAALKQRLIRGHEDAVRESWHRLLAELRRENEVIRAAGSSIVPEISFSDVKYNNIPKMTEFRDKLKKRGVAIIRGVVTEHEALGWKELVKRYILMNPSVTGFPPSNPAVYELYWSPSQILARAHPNLLKAQTFLMSHWHATSKTALISTSHPITYADRLRIRPPGDTGFALGPHMDGGSVERWEENGYGLGGLYNPIFQGAYETYDPWESSRRLPVVSKLYPGPGGSSIYRMFQGWLSLSTTSAHEGTLLTYPAIALSTAYLLLRPFFHPIHSSPSHPSYLSPENWAVEPPPTPSSALPGALPGHGQELTPALHPHLSLQQTMTHIPRVHPGDYVAWHPDTVHAVDNIHAGTSDSSVLYIPACPLTEGNAHYLARQRECFGGGVPGPDFPGGAGEGGFRGKLEVDFVMRALGVGGVRGMGLRAWNTEEGVPAGGRGEGVRGVLQRGNGILGF